MFRYAGIAPAAALLVVAGGCTLTSFLVPSPGKPGPKQVVAGSAEMVAAKLQDALAEAGVVVLVERDRGEIRIAGQTRPGKDGKAFCLHLSDRKVEGSDKTLVHVYWYGRDADPDFWHMVVGLLAAPPAGPPG